MKRFGAAVAAVVRHWRTQAALAVGLLVIGGKRLVEALYAPALVDATEAILKAAALLLAGVFSAIMGIEAYQAAGRSGPDRDQ